jgi:N-acetylglucosaminyldiphosphoundecaprenol N-acetyl-beta-D-mannosaminyltransferase
MTMLDSRPRLRFGRLWVDALTFDDAIAAVRSLVRSGAGGAIFTPNVDHVVVAEKSDALRDAYARASLAFVDGAPLVWASRLLGAPLPAKLSGSDMLLPLAALAGREGWGVYLLGGGPGAAMAVAELLRTQYGVRIVGIDAEQLPMDPRSAATRAAIARVRDAQPQLVFVALGAPKQELWISAALEEIRPAVAMGVGASLDFLAGRLQRAPRWMSDAGLEWAHRLAQNPRRLWRRYLVRGPRFAAILWRTARLPRAERVRVAAARPSPAPSAQGRHRAANR